MDFRKLAIFPAVLVVLSLAASAASDSCTPPPSGMVGWWPGDGNANDIAGGNNGSFNGAGTAPGLVGDAFSFNGAGAYVSVSHDGSLDFSRELTLDAWIFIDSDAPTSMGIVSKYYPVDDHRAYYLGIENNKLKLRAAANGTASVACDQNSANDLPRGEWVHVATTVSASACALYVNGTQVSSTAGIPNIAVTGNVPNLIIGAHGFGDLAHFKGLIDEVEAFDRALSQPEIQAIYDAGANGKCKDQACATPPPDMIAWYPGSGNSNDIAGDNHGSANGTFGYADGLVGQAFSFNGNGYVTMGSDPDLTLTGSQVSVDAWINPAAAGIDGVIVGKTQSGSNDYLLYLSGGVLVGGIKASGTEVFYNGNVSPPAGTWSHVAMTYDGAQMRIYVNGVETGGGPKTGNLDGSSSEISIGGRNFDLLFNGLIDEVEIFNRALTATEIKEIYDAGSNGKCVDAPATPAGSCPPSPAPSCTVFTRGNLAGTISANPLSRRITVRAYGAAPTGFFGDPTSGVSDATCIYDSGNALLVRLEVAGGAPPWTFAKERANYAPRASNDQGVRRVTQRSGSSAFFSVVGTGSNLSLPAIGSVTQTLRVQHLTSLGTCAEITFDSVTVTTATGRFKASEAGSAPVSQ